MFKKKTSGEYKDSLMKRGEDATLVRKIAAVIIIALILIFVVGGVSGYFYIKSALQPVDSDSEKDVSIEIPMGSSTSDIASILEDNGIINDGTIFRFYLKFKNKSGFQAGNYTLSPSMELNEIVNSLQRGKVLEEPLYRITVPEGKTIDEIAEIYAAKFNFSKQAFLETVNDPEFLETLINTYPNILSNDILDPEIRTSLEGYLFAATYNFYSEEPGIKSIVTKMLKKTDEVVTPYLDEISARDMSLHEMLTMASLIEKETGTVEQRPKIAGVFYNRLNEGMQLQTDPTVLYALGEHKDEVLLDDLEVESPYNTYHVNTLPIGPISNFSESSLQAAINPESTDYKYFLHDDEGNIHYAETHEEHNQLKTQYID